MVAQPATPFLLRFMPPQAWPWGVLVVIVGIIQAVGLLFRRMQTLLPCNPAVARPIRTQLGLPLTLVVGRALQAQIIPLLIRHRLFRARF